MEISIDTSGPYGVVHLKGSLGPEDEQQFAEELYPLVADPQAKLAVVLTDVTFIGSSGLGGLISLVTRARLREGRVILVGPTRFVRGVMEVTQLDTWFEVCDDLEEAAHRLA